MFSHFPDGQSGEEDGRTKQEDIPSDWKLILQWESDGNPPPEVRKTETLKEYLARRIKGEMN